MKEKIIRSDKSHAFSAFIKKLLTITRKSFYSDLTKISNKQDTQKKADPNSQ